MNNIRLYRGYFNLQVKELANIGMNRPYSIMKSDLLPFNSARAKFNKLASCERSVILFFDGSKVRHDIPCVAKYYADIAWS